MTDLDHLLRRADPAPAQVDQGVLVDAWARIAAEVHPDSPTSDWPTPATQRQRRRRKVLALAGGLILGGDAPDRRRRPRRDGQVTLSETEFERLYRELAPRVLAYLTGGSLPRTPRTCWPRPSSSSGAAATSPARMPGWPGSSASPAGWSWPITARARPDRCSRRHRPNRIDRARPAIPPNAWRRSRRPSRPSAMSIAS